MTKNPISSLDDNLDFAPFQAFQYRISPDGKQQIRTYTRESGDKSEYHITREPTQKNVYEAYKDIFGAFNIPYARNKNGGKLTRSRYTPDTFTVVIGVVDDINHESADFGGRTRTISYELLFELLDGAGFRPLGILLKNRNRINKEIERVVLKCIKESSSKNQINREYIKNRLENDVGKKWIEKVQDYIAGGPHPALRKKTKEIRAKKLKDNPSLYSNGSEIDKPLVETGNMLNAIKCVCFVEQSDAMKHYIDIVRAYHKKLSLQQERSEKQIEKTRKRTEARHKASSDFEKAVKRKKEELLAKRISKENGLSDESIAAMSKYYDDLAKEQYSGLNQATAWFHVRNLIRSTALAIQLRNDKSFRDSPEYASWYNNFKIYQAELINSAKAALDFLDRTGSVLPEDIRIFRESKRLMYYDDITGKLKEYNK